ncbi:YjfB family protein [Fusibacter bizertensis]
MDIQASSYQTQMLSSVKQALNISVLQKVMKQDAQSVDSVIKAMEQSTSPHLGQNIDIKL